MRRLVGSAFILTMLFGSVDAALDLELEPIGNGDSHEMHGDFHDGPASPGSQTPDGEQGKHFCHCAAHAPAVTFAAGVVLPTGEDSVPGIEIQFYRASRAPPLLPPPIV